MFIFLSHTCVPFFDACLVVLAHGMRTDLDITTQQREPSNYARSRTSLYDGPLVQESDREGVEEARGHDHCQESDCEEVASTSERDLRPQEEGWSWVRNRSLVCLIPVYTSFRAADALWEACDPSFLACSMNIFMIAETSRHQY